MGKAGQRTVSQARHGSFRAGCVRSGKAGKARLGWVRQGSVRQVWHGLFRFDRVRRGKAG
jgi:hypothetical protein